MGRQKQKKDRKKQKNVRKKKKKVCGRKGRCHNNAGFCYSLTMHCIQTLIMMDEASSFKEKQGWVKRTSKRPHSKTFDSRKELTFGCKARSLCVNFCHSSWVQEPSKMLSKVSSNVCIFTAGSEIEHTRPNKWLKSFLDRLTFPWKRERNRKKVVLDVLWRVEGTKYTLYRVVAVTKSFWSPHSSLLYLFGRHHPMVCDCTSPSLSPTCPFIHFQLLLFGRVGSKNRRKVNKKKLSRSNL